MSFVSKLVRGGSLPVHYITCKDLSGRDCYYFLMAPHEKMKLLERLSDEAEFNLTDYGQVIASGFGLEPSAEVLGKLRDYGLEDSAIAKLLSAG